MKITQDNIIKRARKFETNLFIIPSAERGNVHQNLFKQRPKPSGGISKAVNDNTYK